MRVLPLPAGQDTRARHSSDSLGDGDTAWQRRAHTVGRTAPQLSSSVSRASHQPPLGLRGWGERHPPPRGGLGPGGGGAWERVSSRCGSVEAWRASATVVIAVPMARLPRALGFCLRRHIRSVRQAWMCSAWPTSVCRAPAVCETCAGAGGSGARVPRVVGRGAVVWEDSQEGCLSWVGGATQLTRGNGVQCGVAASHLPS